MITTPMNADAKPMNALRFIFCFKNRTENKDNIMGHVKFNGWASCAGKSE